MDEAAEAQSGTKAEDDYWKFSGGATLIAVEVGVDAAKGRPETSAIFGSGGFCVDGDPDGTDRDFGFRIRDEVQVPGGMRVGAVVGGNDSVGVAIFEVEKWCGSRATGSAAPSGEQKDWGFAPAPDDAASKEPVDDSGSRAKRVRTME